MTRGLDRETDVQRGGDPAEISDEARRLGYEPQDAPPRAVALGMAGLTMLMILGLVVCALLLRGLAADEPPAGAASLHRDPPPPRLEDRIIETEDPPAAHQRPPAAIRRAMARVAAEGWRESAPAPPPDRAARAHAGTPR